MYWYLTNTNVLSSLMTKHKIEHCIKTTARKASCYLIFFMLMGITKSVYNMDQSHAGQRGTIRVDGLSGGCWMALSLACQFEFFFGKASRQRRSQLQAVGISRSMQPGGPDEDPTRFVRPSASSSLASQRSLPRPAGLPHEVSILLLSMSPPASAAPRERGVSRLRKPRTSSMARLFGSESADHNEERCSLATPLLGRECTRASSPKAAAMFPRCGVEGAPGRAPCAEMRSPCAAGGRHVAAPPLEPPARAVGTVGCSSATEDVCAMPWERVGVGGGLLDPGNVVRWLPISPWSLVSAWSTGVTGGVSSLRRARHMENMRTGPLTIASAALSRGRNPNAPRGPPGATEGAEPS